MKRFHHEVDLPRRVFSVKDITDIKPVGEWFINNNVRTGSSLITTCGSIYCKHYVMISKIIDKSIDVYKILEY